MAGGPFGAEVVCAVCIGEHSRLTRAVRVHEGVESDAYRCERGHEFGLDWRREPATAPEWPPGPALRAAFPD